MYLDVSFVYNIPRLSRRTREAQLWVNFYVPTYIVIQCFVTPAVHHLQNPFHREYTENRRKRWKDPPFVLSQLKRMTHSSFSVWHLKVKDDRPLNFRRPLCPFKIYRFFTNFSRRGVSRKECGRAWILTRLRSMGSLSFPLTYPYKQGSTIKISDRR